MTFYFTYGLCSPTQPYERGWTEIEADSEELAVTAFNHFHPQREAHLINCAGIWDEEHFRKSRMFAEGNFGMREHERIKITISREEIG